MPAARASAGPPRRTSSPSSSNRPASGWYTPARTFTSVDLPAPFSPTRPCASPARSSIEASSRARTEPNDFVAPSSTSTVAPAPPAAGGGTPPPPACATASLPGSSPEYESFHSISSDANVSSTGCQGTRGRAVSAPEGTKSIRDVAAQAGVSVGTVSNVLNRPHLVAPATRARVQQAITALEFVRNESARQLRAGRSHTLGLVVLDVSNPFFTDVARGVEDAATEAGLAVILCNSDEKAERERRYLDLLEEHRVQGILITPVTGVSERLRQLQRRGTPVVLLDRWASTRNHCSVSVNDVYGGVLRQRPGRTGAAPGDDPPAAARPRRPRHRRVRRHRLRRGGRGPAVVGAPAPRLARPGSRPAPHRGDLRGHAARPPPDHLRAATGRPRLQRPRPPRLKRFNNPLGHAPPIWGDDRIDLFRWVRFSLFGPVFVAFTATRDWAKAVRSVIGDDVPAGIVVVRVDAGGGLRADVGAARPAIAGRSVRLDVVVDSAADADLALISPYNDEGAVFLYYRLLSCGLRLAATAGTDVFLSFSHGPGVASNPPGWGRVYAQLGDRGLSVAAFKEAIRAGRTVVTNGPRGGLE